MGFRLQFGPLYALAILSAPGLGCGGDRNVAPVLAPIGDSVFEVGVGGTVQLQSFDADGDQLTYGFTIDPVPPSFADGEAGRPRIVPITHGALFSWTPSAEDALAGGAKYSVRFAVEDPFGGRSERTMQAEVLDPGMASGGLRFAAPVAEGIYVDAACLRGLRVAIEGGEEGAGVLLEIDAPAAARCGPDDVDCEPIQATQVGPGEYEVEWCPTSAQLSQSVHFPLRFVARAPGSDAVIRKRFFLRHELAEGADCAGDVSVITDLTSAPADAVLDYPIITRITDDYGFKVPPVLVYQRGQDAAGVSSFDGWPADTFERQEGDDWVAAIANVGEDEDDTVIRYAIVATDDDDADSTRCDHITKSPLFVLGARTAGQAEKTLRPCEACRTDAQCGGARDFCVSLLGEGRCGHGCVGQSDCAPGELCLRVESVEGRVVYQCVPSDLDCGQLCRADLLEGLRGNDDRSSARFLEPGTYDGLSICGDDVDFFRLRAEAGQRVHAQIDLSGDQGDLDLAMFLGNVESPTYASLDGQSLVETVTERCLEASGDVYLAVWAAGGAENTYTLQVAVGAGQCEVPCEADPIDVAEGNDALADAVEVVPPWEVQGYTLCGDDLDFFAFDAEAGTSIDVALGFQSVMGDLGLRLYRDGILIGEASSLRDGERLKIYSAIAGRFAVEVFGQGPHPTTVYDLRVTLSEGTVCNSSASCPEGLACIDQLCADPQCTGPADCGPGDDCLGDRVGGMGEIVSGECVILCNESRDCRDASAYTCKRIGVDRGACFLPGSQGAGGRCARHQDCAGEAVCFEWPSGYCAVLGCEPGTCAEGTVCEQVNAEAVCVATCVTDGDCRAAEAYVCRALRPESPKACRPDL